MVRRRILRLSACKGRTFSCDGKDFQRVILIGSRSFFGLFRRILSNILSYPPLSQCLWRRRREGCHRPLNFLIFSTFVPVSSVGGGVRRPSAAFSTQRRPRECAVRRPLRAWSETHSRGLRADAVAPLASRRGAARRVRSSRCRRSSGCRGGTWGDRWP